VGGVKDLQGWCEYGSDIFLEGIKCNVFITRNFIIISHERQIRNKADSTVNKNGDLLNLLVQSWIYK